jgi:hypothetical protein
MTPKKTKTPTKTKPSKTPSAHERAGWTKTAAGWQWDGSNGNRAVAARMGRPSLVAGKGARLTVRCPDALRAKLEARADAMGVSLSDAVAVVLQRGLDVA